MAAFFFIYPLYQLHSILYSLFSILYLLFSILYSLLSIIYYLSLSGRLGEHAVMLKTRRGAQRRRLVQTNTVLRGSESHVLWYQFTDKRSPLALYSLLSIIYSLNKVLYSLLTKKKNARYSHRERPINTNISFLNKKLFLTNCHCSFFISGFCFAASALGTSSAAPFFTFSNLKVYVVPFATSSVFSSCVI